MIENILSVFLVFFNLFVVAFNFILVARIIIGLFVGDMRSNWLGRLLMELTEPVLNPVRKVLPRTGLFDWSPMVVIFGLYALREVLTRLLFH